MKRIIDRWCQWKGQLFLQPVIVFATVTIFYEKDRMEQNKWFTIGIKSYEKRANPEKCLKSSIFHNFYIPFLAAKYENFRSKIKYNLDELKTLLYYFCHRSYLFFFKPIVAPSYYISSKDKGTVGDWANEMGTYCFSVSFQTFVRWWRLTKNRLSSVFVKVYKFLQYLGIRTHLSNVV